MIEGFQRSAALICPGEQRKRKRAPAECPLMDWSAEYELWILARLVRPPGAGLPQKCPELRKNKPK